MKPYLTRFQNLSDAVCNVDYLCHRGCSMSLTLHESCSITLVLRSLRFPWRRGIHFVFFPPAPVSLLCIAGAPGVSALYSQQSSLSNRRDFLLLFSQTNARAPPGTGVSSWLPVAVQLPTRERTEVRKLVKEPGWVVWWPVQGADVTWTDTAASWFFSGRNNKNRRQLHFSPGFLLQRNRTRKRFQNELFLAVEQ